MKILIFLLTFTLILCSSAFCLIKKIPPFKKEIITCDFDYAWDVVTEYLESPNGPGIAKKDIATGLILSSDIIQKKKYFFDLSNRKRTFFEIYLKKINKEQTEIYVRSILLEHTEFGTWEETSQDPKIKENFENKLMQEFLYELKK